MHIPKSRVHHRLTAILQNFQMVAVFLEHF